MKTNFLILSIFMIAGTLLINACSKDDNNNNENWAAAVAGTYTGIGSWYGTSDSATTIFTRVSDKVLNLQLNVFGDSFCLDSVSMNSSTTFTVNEYDGCYTTAETGGGNFNGNNVSYTLQVGTTLTVNGTK